MNTSISDLAAKIKFFLKALAFSVVIFGAVVPATAWLTELLLQAWNIWPENAKPVNYIKPLLIGLPVSVFFIYKKLKTAPRKILVIFLIRMAFVVALLSVLGDAYFFF